MPPTPLLRLCALVAIGANLGWAWQATAQTDSIDPTSQPADVEDVDEAEPPPTDEQVTEPPRKNYFRIDELSLELGFDSQASWRKVKTDPAPLSLRGYEQKNKDRLFAETLGLRSSGNIVDERVLLYDVFFRGGLTQEAYREDGPGRNLDENPHGDIQEYDIRLQAFQSGKVSGSAFASKLESRIPRPFLPSLDQVRTRYGGGLTYNDAKLPMNLSWESTDDSITSDHNYEYDDNEQRDEDRFNYDLTWQPTDFHSLRLDYQYENRGDRYSGTRTRFQTQRNFLSLTDTIQFGDGGKHRLETLLRVEEEQGDLARDAFEVSPRLRLQHTENLFTNYGLQYLKDSYSSLETKTARGDIGVTHLYENVLTSSLNLYGFEQHADENADMSEWGSLSNFLFNKENSLGNLSANLSYVHSQTRSSDGRRDGVVMGEAVTFRDPLPAYLAHSDVNTFNIIVTSADRVQVFLPGRDFLVIRTGRYTALQRVPTGLILDRQTVLVHYTYRVFNNFELARDRVDFRIQEDLKMGLSPYYATSLQDEEMADDKYLTWQERDIHRHRVGATYRRKNWSAGPEYEYNDDSVDPYQAMHFNADATLYSDAKQQVTARGTGSRFFFDGIDNVPSHTTTMIDLGLDYRYQIADQLEAGADAMYRFETDSTFGRTQGIDLSGTLGYRIGLFTLLLEVEYDSLDLPTSSDDSLAVWIKLRREIPVIGENQR